MIDIERQRELVRNYTRDATLALAGRDLTFPVAIDDLPRAMRDRIVVQAAIAYLVGTGRAQLVEPDLVDTAGEEGWHSLQIPAPFRADVIDVATDAVRRHGDMMRKLDAMRRPTSR